MRLTLYSQCSPVVQTNRHIYLCLYDSDILAYVRDIPVHEYCNRSQKIISLQAAAGNIINMLWQLMENSLEELKLLQTVLVLLTTNTVVHDEALSKVSICWCQLQNLKYPRGKMGRFYM